jgi:hypothetical protein
VPRFLFVVPPSRSPRALAEWVAREAAAGVVCWAAHCADGTRLRREQGVTTVSDAGPLWGLLVIEAEDARAALVLAGGCPGVEGLDLYRLDLDDAVGEAGADAATLRVR